jgi:signal transduction histidine kinase/ActR/RegA family two-component response regulator
MSSRKPGKSSRDRMKPFNPTTYFREHFSARIFLTFSVLMIIVSLAFTVFFFRYQSRSLTERTENQGELLARMLAYNARLGAFAENAELLSAQIIGILEDREVLSAAVFSADGKILAAQRRAGKGSSPSPDRWDAEVGEKLKKPASFAHLRDNGNFVCWTRIVLQTKIAPEDAVYLDALPAKDSEQAIGYAKVVLDGQTLRESLHSLLFDSILIGLAFLAIGLVIAYLIAKTVTKPLKKLTAGVNALGAEGEYNKIAVETSDELGNLAGAFNSMVDSLEKRAVEKKELEEQLRHSQKMEAIGTLAGGVAHDFNNMLTAIIGFGTLLKIELTEENKLRTYVEQILLAGEKAAALTHRLLAYSRKQLLNPRPVNLNYIIRSIEKMLSRLITEDIDLKFCLDAENPIVEVDPGQLDHVLINLVTNARDAMPHGGTLTIATGIVELDDDFVRQYSEKTGGAYAAVKVSDSGIGMPEEIREKIFDPFFTTKEVGKGTGLGLSMTYGIIKQHSGIIEVDTAVGTGTSISIYLPLVTRVMKNPDRTIDVVARGQAETILVAEDDPAVMGFLKEILEMNGYNVIEATNGEDAVQKFIMNKEIIRLALLDVIMPRKNGKQVYEEMVGIKADIKTLFMSGYTRDVINRKDALDKGIDIIAKPVLPDELLMKLKEALES